MTMANCFLPLRVVTYFLYFIIHLYVATKCHKHFLDRKMNILQYFWQKITKNFAAEDKRIISSKPNSEFQNIVAKMHKLKNTM